MELSYLPGRSENTVSGAAKLCHERCKIRSEKMKPGEILQD